LERYVRVFDVSDIKECEVIIFSCPTCKVEKRESAREFFSMIPSLTLLPRIACKQCGSTLEVEITEEEEKCEETSLS